MAAGGGRQVAGGGDGAPPRPLLALDNVVIRAGRRTILEVDRFAVAAGERVAVIGPNGAGKTTLLHVAALLRRPDAGRVALHGAPVTTAAGERARRAISVVFQAPLLFDTSVLANAAAGLRFAGTPRPESERRALDWLRKFGVEHLAERRARQLSGGEAGRVALARAFATDPALLLLDEPFSALDAPTRAALLPELAERLRDTATAALLVTHDLDEAFAFGDRIAVMNEGRIVAAGPPADLLAHPPSPEAAALLGIDNVVRATVRFESGGCVLVELSRGDLPIQAVVAPGQQFRPGQVVTLTLPAAAAIALHPGDPVPANWNRLAGEVATATPTPAGFRLSVSTPAPFVTQCPWQPGAPPWRTGDRIVIAFPPEAVHLIRGPEERHHPGAG